ncbi:MAG: peptide chain release factor 1 [Rhodothermia bacterium]|nr:peptide chain release factor 1 [Rhodothermia bacterium]NNL48493.1 peptide chain release factor 1 [Acidimicrobiia bacterium]
MINLESLQRIKKRFAEIQVLMASPEVATDRSRMVELGREHADLQEVVRTISTYESLLAEKKDLETILEAEEDDAALEAWREEYEKIEQRLPSVERELSLQLVPKDPEDSKDAIVEIRAGTGGDEAALFAGDLFRLYSRYAEQNGWRIDVMNSSDGAKGGFKEVIFGVSGQDAFGKMKYESGVHRVQRVPATESSGRIHTSAATVAVLPEAEEVDVRIDPNELKIDVYRSSGPGGQSVNTTDSAVRITHIPTGEVVTCQDEKSQHKNKDKAMRVLRSRLFELEREKRDAERSEARRSMVGSGDRSAKIRTYNWPQGRVTDHRLEGDEKNHPLEKVIEGDLDDIITALRTADNATRMAKLAES